MRNKPQRNPYHRFTVDRHLLEATANAATLAHRVNRADLLLLGSLLHDIGKGFPGDHTEVGMAVVADIGNRHRPSARRRGHPGHHGSASPAPPRHRHPPRPRRSGHHRTGGQGGGQSRPPWSCWLHWSRRTARPPVPPRGDRGRPGWWPNWSSAPSRLLAGEPVAPPTPWITDDLRVIMDTVRVHEVPALSVDDPTVTVVAPDRPGLFAEVTGVLALHGLNVRSAVVAGEEGVAVEIFTVEPARGRWPAAARLTDDLAGVMNGSLSIERKLAERARTYRNEHRVVDAPPGVHPGQRGQQRLGDSIGGRGAGRGCGRPAPPDHPGTGRLPARRHFGQGLHLRFGGRRRLLRPRPGRWEVDRSAADRRRRNGHPPPDPAAAPEAAGG